MPWGGHMRAWTGEACICKDCGGTGICPHGRVKSHCKECGWVSICPHGRWKYECKDCGGAGICAHGRVKRRCKECDGAGICAHQAAVRDCEASGQSRERWCRPCLYAGTGSKDCQGLQPDKRWKKDVPSRVGVSESDRTTVRMVSWFAGSSAWRVEVLQR